MIEEVKYEDWFRNITPDQIPPKGTPERKALRDRERNRCLGGITVDGVYISGWLYWHLNHWWIRTNYEDEYGNIVREECLPKLRDNEWIRATSYEECKRQKKGYMEIGGRQSGKSEYEASTVGYNATLFKNSQNVIVGGNDDDLTLIKEKVDFGIRKLDELIRIPRLDKDWRKSMVRLGYKTKDNDDEVWSFLVIRNVAGGQNTEGPAGVTAKSFIIDECGKFPYGQTFAASKPSFMSEFGWRAIPIIVGTGGAFEKGADAERFFYNPDGNNFLAFTDQESGKRTCLFMSGVYRYDCKVDSNLADYLIAEGKIPEGEYPELRKVPMQVANKLKALDKIKADRALKALDPDQTEYLKEIMYFPLTPQECFLSAADNFFNTDIARQQKERLEVQFPGLRIGMYVDLEYEGDKVISKTSTKLPISTFPGKPNESRDAPVVIIEHPIPDPPYGLYVAGADPFRHEKPTENSDSNGSIVIFKRMYDVMSDSFQDMPVAWYTARPDNKTQWNETARKLIRYFNAQCLCENDEYGFIEYMISKGDSHLMMDTPDWLREVAPTSSTLLRPKGMSMANLKIREMAFGNLKQYMEEFFAVAVNAAGEEKRNILGISKIYDPMLLEEVIKWNKDGNFDRIIAYSLAITCARKMDAAQIQVTVEDEDPRFKTPDRNKRRQHTMFKEPSRYVPGKLSIQRLLK